MPPVRDRLNTTPARRIGMTTRPFLLALMATSLALALPSSPALAEAAQAASPPPPPDSFLTTRIATNAALAAADLRRQLAERNLAAQAAETQLGAGGRTVAPPSPAASPPPPTTAAPLRPSCDTLPRPMGLPLVQSRVSAGGGTPTLILALSDGRRVAAQAGSLLPGNFTVTATAPVSVSRDGCTYPLLAFGALPPQVPPTIRHQ
jgi:type IV pilus biogenesis protein PilP